MKKLLLLIPAAIFIVGCSKNNSVPATITGKWYVTTDSLALYINGTLYEHATYTYDHQNFIEFGSDGNGAEIFIQSTPLGGNAVDNAFAVFTYTLSGNKISYNFPEQTVGTEHLDAFTQTGTITSHTTNSLSIVVDQLATENGNTYKQVEIENCIK